MLSFLRPAAPALSLTDAVAQVAEGRLTLIDVREPGEIAATGKAAAALAIPLSFVPMRADPRHPDFDTRLDPAKPVAVYCASGARSGRAVQILQGLGYASVVNLGGFGDWRAAGGPVVK